MRMRTSVGLLRTGMFWSRRRVVASVECFMSGHQTKRSWRIELVEDHPYLSQLPKMAKPSDDQLMPCKWLVGTRPRKRRRTWPLVASPPQAPGLAATLISACEGAVHRGLMLKIKTGAAAGA